MVLLQDKTRITVVVLLQKLSRIIRRERETGKNSKGPFESKDLCRNYIGFKSYRKIFLFGPFI